jgi:hypothetical protein
MQTPSNCLQAGDSTVRAAERGRASEERSERKYEIESERARGKKMKQAGERGGERSRD